MARRFQSAAVSDISGISWVSNGSHTVACWMYVTTVGGGGDGVYGDVSTNGSQSSQSIWVGCDSGSNWHFEEDGGTYSFTQAASLNTWTHLALTFDGTNCRAYVNGSLVNTAGFNPGTRAVFQYFDTGFTSDMHSQDVVVFSRALSQVEIAGLMRLSEPPMDSLFLWWPELTGAPTLDYSGKRNNWTSDGSSAATTFPPSTFLGPGPRRIWQPASSGTSITASGTTQTTGSASITSAAGLVGAGTTQTTGAAAITSAAGLVASGTTQVTGSAALSASASLVATGTTNVTGTASITSAASLVAAGTTNVTGSAALTSAAPIAASGITNVTGAATVNSGTNFSIDASGLTQTSGSASMTSAAPLTASGLTQTTGAAAMTFAATLQAAGLTQVSGAAAFGTVLTAGGTTNVTGAAVITASAAIVAAGLVNVSGAAAFSGVGPGVIPDPDIADRRWLGALGARRRMRR